MHLILESRCGISQVFTSKEKCCPLNLHCPQGCGCSIYPFPVACKVTSHLLTLKVLVATIDAQWKGMGDVGLARYKPALLPPCLTI